MVHTLELQLEASSRSYIKTSEIKTQKCAIFVAYFKRHEVNRNEVAVVITEQKQKVDADTAHGLLGNINNAEGRKSIEHLGYELTHGSLTPCGACAKSKAKQRSLPSRTGILRVEVIPKKIAKEINERIHLDILSVKAPLGDTINVRKPHWLIKVDERTDMKWRTFHKAKSDIVKPTCEEFYRWKQEGKPVKNVRCDNAGKKSCKNSSRVLTGRSKWTLNTLHKTHLNKTVWLRLRSQPLETGHV